MKKRFPSIGSIVLLNCFMLCASAPAEARRYPITKSDASGTWVGTKSGLLHGTGELWKRYDKKKSLPHSQINDIELSPRNVWVATPRGLARMNKGSRRWEVYGKSNLPSLSVNAVSLDSSDADQVWIGTDAGLAHFNVRTNRFVRFGKSSGLPSVKVFDVLVRGRTVWAATAKGLAAYDTKLKTWTVYGKKQGLAGERVLEIDEQGADIWLTCDEGQSRMNLQRRTFSSFGKAQGLPSAEILAQARLQSLIYLVTKKGLITYDTTSDSLTPFLFLKGLNKADVRSVAAAGGFVWFGTNKGLARFDPTKKVWEYYTVDDGLSSDDLARITVVGSYLMVFTNENTVDTYDYRKDEWVERSTLAAPVQKTPTSQAASQPTSRPSDSGKEDAPKKLRLSVSAELDTELKQDFTFSQREPNAREGHWKINTLRLGAGAQWASGRKLDLSGRLDWGDIAGLFEGDGATLKSFQSYDVELRYLGKSTDLLREAIFSDELRLEPEGGRLTERTELEGARIVLNAGPSRADGRLATLRVAAGLRRGTPRRVVFRRPTRSMLEIKRFELFTNRTAGRVPGRVIPSSVRALLDGKELDRNVDYFVDHDNGVLWLKNTDLINRMRVIEVEFEYEQIPRKNVGAVSMTDLLPKDGDIGQLKRSGRSRWARDEQGLFDEIDGGADQFISRGWVKSLSQDFEWASAGVSLRIYDMADEKNAKSIALSRRLPDAKAAPGIPGCFIERQTSSIAAKCTQGKFYVEITIDQGTMEQETLSMADWLVRKLSRGGESSADALRDYVTSAALDLRFTDNTRVGFNYIGAMSQPNADLATLVRSSQDVFAAHAIHTRKLGKQYRMDARLQAGATSSRGQDRLGRQSGGALLGRLLFSGPKLLLRATGRKYTSNYGGIGIARQTEFCRTADGQCTALASSRLDHELGVDSTLRPLRWLPLELAWQRQSSTLGAAEYSEAPTDRELVGLRDVASAKIGLDRTGLPKLSLGGAFIRRDSPLSIQNQWRAMASFESDLGATILKKLKFKKLYVRGLYEFGKNAIDDYRLKVADERDRDETMHHAVGELRVAPTLTESAYATLEYHGLRGALSSDGRLVDRLTYWRLDAGGGSSIVPGLALRFDGTFIFGDEPPTTEVRRQGAESTLTGIVDVFFGEWAKALSAVRLNAAYTYLEKKQSTAQSLPPAAGVPWGKEICDVAGDEDGDGDADCADSDCAFADACLLREPGAQIKSHRIFGTLSWNTPGKVQAEIFGDVNMSYDGKDNTLRTTKQEFRSFATWRPIPSSPLTLRFDVLRQTKSVPLFDQAKLPGDDRAIKYEPAFEWRRRWSAKWWHLAKVSFSYSRTRDLAHIRGSDSQPERLDFNAWSIGPSVEIRRRFEAEDGTWNFRPYLRASYKYSKGAGVRSRTATATCLPGDACFSDGSETSQFTSLSLGFVWVYAENISVDLDLNAGYTDCIRPRTESGVTPPAVCNDELTFTPHLLATARF